MDTEVMKHMDRAFFLLPYKHVGNTGRLEPENLIEELNIHFSSIPSGNILYRKIWDFFWVTVCFILTGGFNSPGLSN